MFKYLWIIIVAIVEIVWIMAAIKEFSKNEEYTATLLWVTIHGLIIFTTSLTMFIVSEGR